MRNVVRAGIGVMLIKDNKILLGKRHEDPEKAKSELHGEGTWTFPGGKMNFGEGIFEAARREVLEETGIVVKTLKIISIGNEIVRDAHFITIGLLAIDFEGEPKILEPEEIIEWRWFSFDNLPEKIYPPTKKIIRNFLKSQLYGDE